MRPTWPLLALTILQGLAGGLMLTLALAVVIAPHGDSTLVLRGLVLSLALGGLGGLSSFFHMHRIQAARFILRRLRTSWLSREALTTGLFVGALAVLVLARLLIHPLAWLDGGVAVVAGLGAVAVFVTAMLYATIPAMRSWHSPLTVVSLIGFGLLSGLGLLLVLLVWPAAGGPSPLWAGARDGMLVLLVIMAAVKGLQWRLFQEARNQVRAATGTGLPMGPYRLQDTGTTRPPYRTQPQTWPPLQPRQRQIGYLLLFLLAFLGPFVAYAAAPPAGGAVAVLTGTIALLSGTLVERWMFFRDSTHSSRVWFGDQAWQPSQVAEPARSTLARSAVKTPEARGPSL
jgi:DMSO reductase anchor subunit